jgi:catalase
MQGSGVNTYKWVNEEGVGVLIKYHWEPKQAIKNLTQAEAELIQGKNFNHATQDLFESIAKGEFPEWELCVQIMSDGDHPELNFDPLDATKLWPVDQFPFLPVGRMVLNRNPENYFAEVEQVAFGTGVLVDGLDFSDDKLLQGRTFSYSDTQRYRVGTNYLQLPINAPRCPYATNQRDGQMAFHQDIAPGTNPHVNYEPSSLGGLKEAPKTGKDHTPHYNDNLVREKTPIQNDFIQPGERFRMLEEWERNDLILNLVNTLKPVEKHIQDRMVELFTQCDAEYGRRVAEGLRTNTNNDGGPIGTTNTHEAVVQAEEQSKESKAY